MRHPAASRGLLFKSTLMYFPWRARRRREEASRDSRKRNRGHRAVPKECRTSRATLRGPCPVLRVCAHASQPRSARTRRLRAHAVHAQSDQLMREKFSERGSHCFEMRACRDEIHIGLHGKARSRKNAVAAPSDVARKPGGFDELQPLFDAAGFCAVAIVIEDALAPGEAERRVFAAGEDRSIFNRDPALVEVTIQRPRLKLAARQLALMHQQMKRMLVVIACFANRVKAVSKFRFGEKRLFNGVGCWSGHDPKVRTPCHRRRFRSRHPARRGARRFFRQGWGSYY